MKVEYLIADNDNKAKAGNKMVRESVSSEQVLQQLKCKELHLLSSIIWAVTPPPCIVNHISDQLTEPDGQYTVCHFFHLSHAKAVYGQLQKI